MSHSPLRNCSYVAQVRNVEFVSTISPSRTGKILRSLR